MPVMSVAIGIYLPLYLSVPIMAGGIISHILLSSARLRIDGTLEGEPSEDATAAVKEVQDKGVLIGAGFIAGESYGSSPSDIHSCRERPIIMVWRNWNTILHTISGILWMVRCSFHNVISVHCPQEEIWQKIDVCRC